MDFFNHYTLETTTTITTMKSTSTHKGNNYRLINVKNKIWKFHAGGLKWDYTIFRLDLLKKFELLFRALGALGVIPNLISQSSASNLIDIRSNAYTLKNSPSR